MPASHLTQIDQPATSLLVETGKPWDRKTLLKNLQERFASHLALFKTSGFAPFHHPLQALLALKGQHIRCFDGEKYHAGICHSLAPDGRLNLLLADNTIQAISAGDIITS
jgi:BirA family transcriptional regulator, biotin operon repressor / biotin---[acetyl-CoA-carboxylase] ligase